MRYHFLRWAVRGLVVCLVASPYAEAACCYFSARNTDILQPAQKVFITWNPETKVESFTVQPKFEGNAVDFGMVIPTPSQPKLHEMPRDFFKELAVYTILEPMDLTKYKRRLMGRRPGAFPDGSGGTVEKRKMIKVLEAGIVGSLDYKIIQADNADDLFSWLK